MTTAELPVTKASDLGLLEPEAPRFLVDTLWAQQAVGIVGGEPKCGKSFLALHLAVAVASGTPCLGRYNVARKGPVLLYPAEDSQPIVRDRLAGISHSAGVSLDALDVFVITAPALRLDTAADRERLGRSVVRHRPVLLILDPFVRLHRIDENASGEVAPLLAFLRQLQRTHGVAILVVHHARKGARGMRPGQALRGSSEFHAWGDSNLYVSRRGQQIRLAVEHRGAPSHDGLALEMTTNGHGPHLSLCALRDDPRQQALGTEPVTRILDVIEDLGRPATRAELRERCRIKTTTLSQTLAELVATDRLHHRDDGSYDLVD
jgi:hypothetical protein